MAAGNKCRPTAAISGVPDALAAGVGAAGALVASAIRTAETTRMVAAVGKSAFISSSEECKKGSISDSRAKHIPSGVWALGMPT